MPENDVFNEPTREELDAMAGPVLVEFGAAWCGFCQALAPELRTALDRYPTIRHIKIEDGPGRRLGRSFRVKLWPTLVFLRDGQIVKQVSRPNVAEIREGLGAISEEG